VLHRIAFPVVSEWCQQSVFLLLHASLIKRIWLTYAERGRVTDGTRTRALRSHNPLSPVSRRCRMLQNRLI
jgi:hypothetical protein